MGVSARDGAGMEVRSSRERFSKRSDGVNSSRSALPARVPCFAAALMLATAPMGSTSSSSSSSRKKSSSSDTRCRRIVPRKDVARGLVGDKRVCVTWARERRAALY